VNRNLRNIRKSDLRFAADTAPTRPDRADKGMNLDDGQLRSVSAVSDEQRADAVRAVLYRFRNDPPRAFEVLSQLGLVTAARELHRDLRAGAR